MQSSPDTEREIFPYVTENELRLELVEQAKKMALGENRDHPWKDNTSLFLLLSRLIFFD
ncbi:MAG: hypothetical protein FWH57_07220 [Oscillospiraceae bacterium]|nr:hypothetical protein [Oscillospiraceae bacterium]